MEDLEDMRMEAEEKKRKKKRRKLSESDWGWALKTVVVVVFLPLNESKNIFWMSNLCRAYDEHIIIL